jgi:hypothetical protein
VGLIIRVVGCASAHSMGSAVLKVNLLDAHRGKYRPEQNAVVFVADINHMILWGTLRFCS